MESAESPPPPQLTSPFEDAVQHSAARSTLLRPHLSSHNDEQSHEQSNATQSDIDAFADHPLLQRARLRAKSQYASSPLLHDEYIFPRFSIHELQLGRVLGRGGFGTVLAIERFHLNGKTTASTRACSGGNVDGRLRQAKSLDALEEGSISGLQTSTVAKQTKSKRKRRSVSLGLGQRHDFFRRGKRGDAQELDPQKEEDKENNNVVAIADQVTQDVHPLEAAKQQCPSTNFSFVSWKESVPGQEGRNAIDESDLRFLNWIDENEPIPKILEDDEKESNDDHTKETPQCDEPIDQNGSSPPRSTKINHLSLSSTLRRRIILFSNNDNSNASFDLNISLRPNILQDKYFLSQHVTTSKGKSRYVVKIISPHIVRGEFKQFLQAAADMATETYFFSVLNHRHLLKLRAVGQGDMFSPLYFLVMDRLYDTLSDRISGSWKRQCDHLENDFFVWNRWKKSRDLWEERVSVAKDLAAALGYMHDMCIIYRDLKPENVGFDSRGVTKLFDFGLAKQLFHEDAIDDTYKLTPNTGSLRYMAPEVGNGWSYNFNADSYSFTILLWEMLALETPFRQYTSQEIVNMVRKWGERPKLNNEWSDRLKECIGNGWDSNFRKRPTMKDFETILDLELHESQTD